jgi:hypothetical protein
MMTNKYNQSDQMSVVGGVVLGATILIPVLAASLRKR